MGVHILRCLKEELAWATDKWLSNIMFSFTTKKLKNKAILCLNDIVNVAM